MKGLRLTCIKSEGLKLNFYRYQLWEHEIIPVQSGRENLWLPGRIIHHLKHWLEVREYVNALGPRYEEIDLEFSGISRHLTRGEYDYKG